MSWAIIAKKFFFVAPSIQPAKLKFLQKKGIEYVESTAENLLTEINEDLKFNYLPGLNKGIGSADIAFDFAKANNINIGLSKHNHTFSIDKVVSLNGIGTTEVKFTIEGESEKTAQLFEAIHGKNFDDVLLTGDMLKEYSHFFNGIRINNQENISSLHIKKVPSLFGMFNIVFEDGFELDNYYLEIFIANPNETEAKLKIKANDFDILITIEFTSNSLNVKVNIEIEPSKSIKSVKNGLNFYNILSRITSNQKFKMFKENKLIFNYKERIVFYKDAFGADFLMDYFYKLRKIENFFNVQFTDISLSKSNEETMKYINAYIDKIVLEEEFNGMTFQTDNMEEFNHIINSGQKENVFVISEKEKSKYKLHGIDLTIGYLHKYVQDAFVDNLEDLIKATTKEINVKSKSNTLYYQFTNNKTMIKQ